MCSVKNPIITVSSLLPHLDHDGLLEAPDDALGEHGEGLGHLAPLLAAGRHS